MKFNSVRLLVLFAGAVLGFTAVSLQTNRVAGRDRNDNQDDIEYGIVYDCGAGKGKFKVIECDGDEDSDWCKVQYLNESSPGGVGSEHKRYRELIKNDIAGGCKPKKDAKKKTDARPRADTEAEAEQKPAPKPNPKPTPKPETKPAPEKEPEPAEKNQQTEDQPPEEASSTGPQFQLGDCVQVGNSQGIITKSDGENFYVQTGDGEKRVPLSTVSKLKKATGCN